MITALKNLAFESGCAPESAADQGASPAIGSRRLDLEMYDDPTPLSE